MATFAKSTFSHASYAAFRPTYPASLYKTVLAYHRGPKKLCIDLGTGPGIVARELGNEFTRVIGTDPSAGMIAKAKDMTPASTHPNVEFAQAPAEEMPFVRDESVDVVVAGQAAHWFDYPRLFPELKRVLRRGGTLAFWGYKDNVFVDYPEATRILHECSHNLTDKEKLGYYWQQPGRSICEGLLRAIELPSDAFEDEQRIEYEPSTQGARTGKGTMFLSKTLTVKSAKAYVRTWSSFSAWQEKHPDQKARSEGGQGDVVDRLFDEMSEAEGGWESEDTVLETEWGSVLLLARRK